jgi:hypothetical protein
MKFGWRHLYHSLLKENKTLKKQIEVLESILRIHLPIVEIDIKKRRDNE